MTFDRIWLGGEATVRRALLLGATLALVSCGTTQELDDTTGSRLIQPTPVPNAPPRPAQEVGDVAIAGQEAAHAILDIPAIAGAPVPPIVQFSGVTSLVVGPPPVDTEPYTTLLRDRLLLLTRLKLRFVERTLPPLVSGKKSKSSPPATPLSDTHEYRLLAELRGKVTSDLYWFQIQFIDTRTNELLYDGLFRIRKEASEQPVYETAQPAASATPTYQPTPEPNYAPTGNQPGYVPAPKDPYYYQDQPGSNSLQ